MSISELTIVKEIKTLDAFNSRPQARFPGAGICGVISTIDAHPGDTPLENSGPPSNGRE
jgi:hypothetical protein